MKDIVVKYSKPLIEDNDINSVIDVLNSDMLASGQIATEFANTYAHVVNAKYGVTTTSCTTALYTALRSLGVGRGEAVIVPSMTFTGTAEAVLMNNADLVLADIDENSLMISKETIQKAAESYNRKTGMHIKAVIVVHYGGEIAEIEDIEEYCIENKIDLVNDCAHCLESEYLDKKDNNYKSVGELPGISCYSLYPTKCITTGLGGVITCNDENTYAWCSQFIHHGISRHNDKQHWDYDVVSSGFNLCMSNIQAGLGLSQLSKHLKMYNHRKQIKYIYDNELKHIAGIRRANNAEGRKSSHHIYSVYSESETISRDKILNRMQEKGIQLSVHWKPLHEHVYYKQLIKEKRCYCDEMKNCDKVWRKMFSLPCHNSLTKDEQYIVIDELNKLSDKV